MYFNEGKKTSSRLIFECFDWIALLSIMKGHSSNWGKRPASSHWTGELEPNTGRHLFLLELFVKISPGHREQSSPSSLFYWMLQTIHCTLQYSKLFKKVIIFQYVFILPFHRWAQKDHPLPLYPHNNSVRLKNGSWPKVTQGTSWLLGVRTQVSTLRIQQSTAV